MKTVEFQPVTGVRIPVFSARLGVVAILLPAWATLAGEILMAFLLMWGAVGLWFAWGGPRRPQVALSWHGFGACFLLGLGFFMFPGVGISACLRSWGWLVFNGLSSLAIGVIILIGWPEAAVRASGMLLGVNFLTTGLSLNLVGKARKRIGPT